MAGVLCVGCCSAVYFLTILHISFAVDIFPTITSVYVLNQTVSRIKNEIHYFRLEIHGQHLSSDMKVRATSDKSLCSEYNDLFGEGKSSFNVNQLNVNNSKSVMSGWIRLENGDNVSEVYLCVKSDNRTGHLSSDVKNQSMKPLSTLEWIHQGESVFFRTKEGDGSSLSSKPSVVDRRRRQTQGDTVAEDVLKVYGLKLERSDEKSQTSDDNDKVPELLTGSKGWVRLFGTGWTDTTTFALTKTPRKRGEACDTYSINPAKIIPVVHESKTSALMELPVLTEPDTTYYFCSSVDGSDGKWKHLGDEPYLRIRSYQKFLPLWLQLIIIVVCLGFSSLFSGLNLGLMSLDRTDLRIICNTGTEAEQKHAHKILPVREHGNYLLCSILLGNVMVNSTFTILLDDLTSGMVAIIVSTLLIVICGEISPQAVCSRHGLAIGAKTIYITRFVMVATWPLAYPISKVLDCLLGEEIGAVYTRERLKELVKLTTEYNDLEKDEVNIISGALELRKKVVGDVMTKLEDAFMLPSDAILDFETVSEIMKSGFSRIPVYTGSRKTIISVLYIKDLALVDPDDNTPVKMLCEFYQNSCYFVFEDTTLDVLFKQFKEGIKGHMAFVHRVNNETDGDPFYEAVGLITLEDVIEELIQAEIMDETDVWTDNRSKNRRINRSGKKDFTLFAERNENQRIHISPQLTLATFQFLSTSIDAFKHDQMSETILSRLLKQDIIYQIKIKNREKIHDDPHTIIYQQGKPADYFVLILEGRVEVTMGRENMVFESGPFTYFGLQALTQNVGVGEPKQQPESPTAGATHQPLGSLQSVNLESMMRYTFVPDYTVRAVMDTYYLRIRRAFYLAAKRATLMERSKKEESNSGDNFEDEVDKLFHTYDEDQRSQGSPDITRTQSQRGTPGQTSPNTILNNGGLLTTSEPALVSPSRTPRSSDSLSPEERTNLLRSKES